MDEREGMKGVFYYPEWQVEEALLDYHEKKASFNPKKYDAQVHLSYGDRGEFVVVITEKIGPKKSSVVWQTIKVRLKQIFWIERETVSNE